MTSGLGGGEGGAASEDSQKRVHFWRRDSDFWGGWFFFYLDAGVVDENGPARREHLRQALVVQRRPERARDAFKDGRHPVPFLLATVAVALSL